MDEKAISRSFAIKPEEKNFDTLYPMFFGVSCAFFALKLLPEPEEDDKWSEIRNRMLKGSAHLLGMFIWKAKTGGCELLQKLENAQNQVVELKKRRSEEARANEKVVSIIASREQTWFDERRRLRQHIGALVKELTVVEMMREKSMLELNQKLKEREALLQEKDKSIEEGEQRRREIEERAKKAEKLVDELTQTTKLENERHSSEILKHKTAFIEIVSNQRQLEAEMGRALRQVDALKHELESVSKQKEQSVLMAQRLSTELVKTRKELEHKDQILSAMLRKAKLDAAEKHMLLKETKSSKAKRKQAESGTARWNAFSEAKNERHSLRNMLSKRANGKGFHSMDAGNFRSAKGDNHRAYSYSTEGSEKQRDAELLENWVDAEAETRDCAIERHDLEIDAFVEQLRLKDEKLEAVRWRLLSMELESKRLQSHVKGLDHEITELRQENEKLEAFLIDRDAELHLLKEQLVLQFNPPNLQKLNFSSSIREATTNHSAMWSKVKVVKRKSTQKKQVIAEEISNEKADEVPSSTEKKEIERDGKVAAVDSNNKTSTSTGKKSSSTMWKMDIHALGVLYKIKRLKQQFVMLERLAGKQESCENSESSSDNGRFGVKGFYALTSLLNKQVDRYQSLQEKTDDICQRMHDNNLNSTVGGDVDNAARPDYETKKLEHFLEETFQLQRYIVATGQKLMEVQARIASGFVNDAAEDIEKPESFDMKRFADSVRTLFQEVQRGLEIRISRIIGDLEGTLACDGMTIHLRK
ncbi:probable myosin heavy chain ECU04_1000 [Andrographis paniculata]|uniref:probable myosin heavy chain ECU04_1000 n=1 Tax=Andrographis paniculata TaxID=175694 RepID=UPI0021E99112|nr:probable myosin heavy chain ECU04_1000 [Andrographis paniculata]